MADALTFNIHLEDEDWGIFQQFVLKTHINPWTYVAKYLGDTLLYSATFLLLITLILLQPLASDWLHPEASSIDYFPFMIIAWIPTCLIATVVFALAFFSVKRKTTPKASGFIMRDKTFTINSQGVRSRCENSEYFCNWSMILKIEESDKAIYLFFENFAAFIFPKYQLEDCKVMLNTLHAWQQDYQKSHPPKNPNNTLDPHIDKGAVA